MGKNLKTDQKSRKIVENWMKLEIEHGKHCSKSWKIR